MIHKANLLTLIFLSLNLLKLVKTNKFEKDLCKLENSFLRKVSRIDALAFSLLSTNRMMSKKQIVQAQDEWAQDQPSGIQKIFEHWKRSMRDSKQKEREREYELAQNLSREALTIFKKIRAAHYNMNLTLSQEHKFIEKVMKTASSRVQKELYDNKLVHLSNTCVSPSQMINLL